MGDDFQTQVMAFMQDISRRLEKIENALLLPKPEPVLTGGLFDFVKPEPVEPRYGLGVEMRSADVAEAKRRACYGVNWRGGQTLSGQNEIDVWREIERLKAGDPDLLPHYSMLDPEMAGFGLLTGLFDVVAYDGRSFGINRAKRESYVGENVASFMDTQFAIISGGGTPSGG